jgi:hypothetical protein
VEGSPLLISWLKFKAPVPEAGAATAPLKEIAIREKKKIKEKKVNFNQDIYITTQKQSPKGLWQNETFLKIEKNYSPWPSES